MEEEQAFALLKIIIEKLKTYDKISLFDFLNGEVPNIKDNEDMLKEKLEYIYYLIGKKYLVIENERNLFGSDSFIEITDLGKSFHKYKQKG